MPLYKTTLFLRDAYGRETTRSGIVSAVDPVSADLLVGGWANDVQDVTKLHVYKHQTVIEGQIAGAPEAGANRDEGMTISVLLDGGLKKASINIPGPIDAIRNPDGTIDITSAVMLALEDNYQTSILISDGELSDSFIKATLDS
jgi:hypothetical protein